MKLTFLCVWLCILAISLVASSGNKKKKQKQQLKKHFEDLKEMMKLEDMPQFRDMYGDMESFPFQKNIYKVYQKMNKEKSQKRGKPPKH